MRRGGVVPLGTLVEIRDTQSPTRVSRYNMYSTAEINGMTLPGVSSGQGIEAMDRFAAEALPRGFGVEWTGLTYQQIIATRDASVIQRPTTVFLLSVLFVFLVLAAQYESWFVPLAVILTVPLALLGAGIGLLLRGLDNSIFTQIGLVLLIGLGAKNAILIVEFARLRRAQGESLRQAAVEASKLRLRPILMTSFAFILGVVPLVWSHGAGAESRQALGTAVFAGMIASSLLGVLFTPVFFVIIQWFNELVTGGPRLAKAGARADSHETAPQGPPAPADNGEGHRAPAPGPAEPEHRPPHASA
jgi:multidrug efflux pump subunit AcrB